MHSLGRARIDLVAREVDLDGTVRPLRGREAELLAFLLAHPQVTHPRDALLRSVWNYRGGIETRVVDVTVSRLRQKIGDRDGTVIRTVTGEGYRLEPPTGRAPTRAPPGLLGRDPVFGVLDGLEEAGARLITLHGAPGTGKSLLAQAWLGDRPHQRVDLHEVRDPSVVASLEPPSNGGWWFLDGADFVLDALAQRLSQFGGRALVTAGEAVRTEDEAPVALPPLDPESARAWLARACPGAPVDQIELVVERFDGNPLALALVAERGASLGLEPFAATDGSVWSHLKTDRRGGASHQRTFHTAMARALAALPDGLREVAPHLAMVRGGFRAVEAAPTLGRSVGDTLELLDALSRRGWLSAQGDGWFRWNGCAGDWLQSTLGPSDQARELLASTRRAVADAEVALERLEAGEPRGVWQWMRHRGAGLAAWADAVALVDPVLAARLCGAFRVGAVTYPALHPRAFLLERLATDVHVPPEVRARLSVYRGFLAFRSGQSVEARQWLDRARELPLDPDDLHWADQEEARTLAFSGEVDAAVALLTRAAARAEAEGRRLRLAWHLQTLASTCWNAGRRADAVAAYERVVALEHWVGAFPGVRRGLGVARTQGGAFVLGEAFLRQAIDLARAAGTESDLAPSHVNLAWNLLEQGRSDEALRELDRAEEVILRQKAGQFLAFALATRILAALEQQDEALVDTLLLEAFAALSGSPFLAMEGIVSELAALHHARGGRWPEAVRALDRSLELWARLGNEDEAERVRLSAGGDPPEDPGRGVLTRAWRATPRFPKARQG